MAYYAPFDAVRIIASMTRSDYDLGTRAWRLWHERHDLDPAGCVQVALQERRAEEEKGAKAPIDPDSP